MKKLIFKKVFTGTEWLENQAISIENGIISAMKMEEGGERDGFLCAGFIDLQVYGGGGLLFSNQQTTEAIQATFDEHIKTGTTHFQITLNCSPKESMWRAIAASKNYQGFGLIGLHLEGPFFNPIRRGAHQEAFVQQPDLDFLNQLIDQTTGLPTYMTIAPEMFSEKELNRLIHSPLMLSIGHSEASFEEAKSAIAAGIPRITHLFNAMSQWQSRALGIVGASFLSDAWTSIIVDGQHCDFESVRLAKKLKGTKLFLITDAVTHDESGPYFFAKKGDRFTNDQGTLSGSALTMVQAIQNCVNKVDIPLDEALRMATLYPAEVVNRSHEIGSIGLGKKACFVHLSDDLIVQQVWYNGQAML
jgi:N-acetylglucosamine-6-phosphate deacetylase